MDPTNPQEAVELDSSRQEKNVPCEELNPAQVGTYREHRVSAYAFNKLARRKGAEVHMMVMLEAAHDAQRQQYASDSVSAYAMAARLPRTDIAASAVHRFSHRVRNASGTGPGAHECEDN